MNEILQQLHDRKSVRVYEDRPIEAEVKQAILEAAIQAPTAGNMALYTILDITDQEMKQKLSVSCDNQPFIATAPMVLIFCADYRRWYDVFCAHVEEVRKPALGDLFLAQADTLIAAQNVVHPWRQRTQLHSSSIQQGFSICAQRGLQQVHTSR